MFAFVIASVLSWFIGPPPGRQYAGSPCPDAVTAVSIEEDVFVDDRSCPDGWWCFDDSAAAPSIIALGSFCRTGPCAYDTTAVPREVLGIRVSGGSDITFELTPFADGACNPGGLFTTLTASTVEIDGGSLRVRGSTATILNSTISNGGLTFENVQLPSSAGAGIVLGHDAEFSASNCTIWTHGMIEFGHVDGAAQSIALTNTFYQYGSEVWAISADDANISIALDGGSISGQAVEWTGTSTHVSAELAGNAFISSASDVTCTGGSGDMTFNEFSRLFSPGTCTITGDYVVAFNDTTTGDCDRWTIEQGASVFVDENAEMVSFVDPCAVGQGGTLTLRGKHVGDIVVNGALEMEGGTVEGTVASFEIMDFKPTYSASKVTEMQWRAGWGFSPTDVSHDIGTLLVSAGATFAARWRGQAPGPAGAVLACTESATIDGTLTIEVIEPVLEGEQRVLISAPKITGTFANEPDGWTVVYEPNQVRVIANRDMTGGSTPGDVNGDGVVDTTDLLAVLAAWGPCDDPGACPADLDGSGAVDTADLLEVLGNWG